MIRDNNKDFIGWIKLKIKLHFSGNPINISESEVWWCAMGENVGTEINGKSKRFSRPVVILKKFGRYGFWGVPLTTRPHEGSWYVKFKFQNSMEIAAVHQMRLFDVSRLYNKIGQLSELDFKNIIDRAIDLLESTIAKNVPRS